MKQGEITHGKEQRMKRGHVSGTKRERTPRASTVARDVQKAVALEQRVAELAKQMMASWQVK